MQSMRAKIAQFESCFSAQALLDRSTPLLDVLRRRVGLKGGETNRCDAQYRRTKVQVSGNNPRCGSEVIALLRFRKDVGNVVTLVAPGVHVNRSEEDAERRMQNEAVLMKVMCDAKARM